MSTSVYGKGISGSTYDFFFFDSSGQVYNGSTFVAWSDGDFTTYRQTATETGSTGRFLGTAPTGTIDFELRLRDATLSGSVVVYEGDLRARHLLEADRVAKLDGGVYKEFVYERGTSTELITAKTIKQPGGSSNITNPSTEKYGGATE